MSAHVEGQKYRGVDMTNPRIKEYVQNMVKNGERNEKICEVVGVPHEVVESIRKDTEGRSTK